MNGSLPPALEPEAVPQPTAREAWQDWQPRSSTARQPAANPAEGLATRASRSHMTARGAIVAMLGLFLAANLLASWFGHEVVAGLSYLVACAGAPYLVRKHVLLQVVVAPPAVFLIALVMIQMVTAQGTGKHGKTLSVLEGTVLILAALAPWLLAGTVICVGVAMPRGLRQCVRDLRRDLKEDVDQRQPWAPRLR